MNRFRKTLFFSMLGLLILFSGSVSILQIKEVFGQTYSKEQLMSMLEQSKQTISEVCNAGGDQYVTQACEIIKQIMQIDETILNNNCVTSDQVSQLQSLFSQLSNTLRAQTDYYNSLGANIPTGALNQFGQDLQQITNQLTQTTCSSSFGFTINPDTSSITLVSGGPSKKFSVAVNLLPGSDSERVLVGIQSPPPIHNYIQVNWNPSAEFPPFTSSVNISVKSGAPSGTYPIYIVISGGVQIQKATIYLNVISASGPSNGKPNIDWKWKFDNINTILVTVTNNGDGDANNVKVRAAWDASKDAGYNKVWAQYTYGPFLLKKNYLEQVTFHLKNPPAGKHFRLIVQIGGDNVNLITSYGKWMTN